MWYRRPRLCESSEPSGGPFVWRRLSSCGADTFVCEIQFRRSEDLRHIDPLALRG